MSEPSHIDHPLYNLLQEENISAFNAARARGESVNLRGAYLRSADLRGIDFRQARLDGASLHEAKISGVYFPSEISAHEIFLSVDRGTRLRAQR